MSATNRGSTRREHDAYNTAPELADAIVRRLVVDGMIERSRALRVLEPHAGTGAFVRALRVALPGARIVAIVGNPPFSLAERHVRHALALLAPGGVLAFLLRLAFVETRSRFALLREHPLRALYALSERPSFTGGGSDMACYGVFVWQRGGAGPAVFRVLAASTGRVA